ncbi:hypothetical protein ACFRIC_41540 [Streptomyces sp. NPDC056738]|uniref:hypothetical protein n=1 Tax=Streptomyces sp. NPDC056738 TaxID=3345933 RepID=UPI0036AB873A
MSTGGSLPEQPSDDATVVRYGQREITPGLIATAFIWSIAALGLSAAALLDDDVIRWLLASAGGLCALCGLFLLIGTAATSDDRFVFDATGWWSFSMDGDALLTWDSLAGVCICSTGDAAAEGGTATLELFPREDFDRDHPVLWRHARDADPPADGLPRLRYRVGLTNMVNVTPDVELACSRWVPPDLWHGRKWQPAGYKGRPDRAGHRRRLRERARNPLRTENPTPPPPPQDAAPPVPPQERRTPGT